MIAVYERVESTLTRISQINPPPGQVLRCDGCRLPFTEKTGMVRVPVKDRLGLYPTGEQYFCRDCEVILS